MNFRQILNAALGKIFIVFVLLLCFWGKANAKDSELYVAGDGFSLERPTVLYLHSGVGTKKFDATFPNYHKWNKKGFNTLYFDWRKSAYEEAPCRYFQPSVECIDTAEKKIWGNGSYVGEKLLAAYMKYFGARRYYKKEVRVVGHGLGAQLGVYLTFMLHDSNWNIGVLPKRLELLDLYVSTEIFRVKGVLPLDSSYRVPWDQDVPDSDCNEKNIFDLSCIIENSLYVLFHKYKVGIAAYSHVLGKATASSLRNFINYREFKSHEFCDRGLFGLSSDCKVKKFQAANEVFNVEHLIPVYYYFFEGFDKGADNTKYVSPMVHTLSYLSTVKWIRQQGDNLGFDDDDNAALKTDSLNDMKFIKFFANYGISNTILKRVSVSLNARKIKSTLVSNLQGLSFDPKFYLSKHGDLKKKFRDNVKAATKHWNDHGIYENRKGYEPFDVRYYLAKYDDLRTTFKKNYSSATKHWYDYGIWEGRVGAAPFDVNYYVAKYPDIRRAFGNNTRSITNHWYDHGIAEGRNGGMDFDPHNYMLYNSDVKHLCGVDPYCAIAHWYSRGIAEGRAWKFEDYIGTINKGGKHYHFNSGSYCLYSSNKVWETLTKGVEIYFQPWMNLGEYQGKCSLENSFIGNIQKKKLLYFYSKGKHCLYGNWKVWEALSGGKYVIYEKWMDIGKYIGKCNLLGVYSGDIFDKMTKTYYNYDSGTHCNYESAEDWGVYGNRKYIVKEPWMIMGRSTGKCSKNPLTK
jgi:hypothetical protein